MSTMARGHGNLSELKLMKSFPAVSSLPVLTAWGEARPQGSGKWPFDLVRAFWGLNVNCDVSNAVTLRSFYFLLQHTRSSWRNLNFLTSRKSFKLDVMLNCVVVFMGSSEIIPTSSELGKTEFYSNIPSYQKIIELKTISGIPRYPDSPL